VIRINLIPPEILQNRMDEQRWKWVWLGGGVLVLAIAVFWGVMMLQVTSASIDVASVQQEASNLQSQTSRFAIFQQKESDLAARKAAVTAVVKNRIDWARMLNELGLVLPKDVYLTTFTGTDGGSTAGASGSSVTLAGQALDSPNDAPDNGYKSVAKMLVRLSEMQQLDSVWLTNTSIASGDTGTAPMITWAVTARVTPGDASQVAAPTGN
jgi:Tfp pilus assembly protein PilN